MGQPSVLSVPRLAGVSVPSVLTPRAPVSTPAGNKKGWPLPWARASLWESMVPEVGIEPTRAFARQILSLVRLPIPPLRLY